MPRAEVRCVQFYITSPEDGARFSVEAFYCDTCDELHYQFQLEGDVQPRRFDFQR